MFEAYRIGITIALTNQVSAGLGLLAQQFRGTDKDAAKLKATLKDIKLLGTTGALIGGAGVFGLAALKAPLEEAKLYQSEMARFAALGYGDAVNKQADQVARGLDIIGMSARDNLTLLREVTGIMGDFEHAQQALPMLAKMKSGLENVMGAGEGSKFEQMFQAAIKVSELRGALVDRATGQIDLGKFGNALNQMTQAYVASGGLVKPTDYLAAIKTGGVSTKMMSDEMFYFGLGHFMQESGGSRTGTAAMSMFQNLAMGRMTQQVAEQLQKYGLLDAKKIHYGTTGHITKVDPMGIINSQQFIDNPFKWMNETVVPRLKAQGLQGNDVNMAIARMLGIRTAQNLADQMVREQQLAERYMVRSHQAADSNKLYTAGGDTLTGKENDLQAKWNSLMLELGDAILPSAIEVAQGLIAGLKPLVHWMQEHQQATKALVLAFAGLSIMATLAGSVLVLTAAMKGLLLFVPGSGMAVRQAATSFLGVATAANTAKLSIGTLIGVIGRMGMTALGVHEVLAAIDPHDEAGSSMDRNHKWAAAFDDWTSRHIGLGRSYDDQVDAETDRRRRKGETDVSNYDVGSSLGMILGEDGKWGTSANGGGFAADMARRKQEVHPQKASLTPGDLQAVASMVGSIMADKLNGAAVNMDGRQVGSLVMKQVNRDANRPPDGSSGFDLKLQPAFPTGGSF